MILCEVQSGSTAFAGIKKKRLVSTNYMYTTVPLYITVPLCTQI